MSGLWPWSCNNHALRLARNPTAIARQEHDEQETTTALESSRGGALRYEDGACAGDARRVEADFGSPLVSHVRSQKQAGGGSCEDESEVWHAYVIVSLRLLHFWAVGLSGGGGLS
jgi:hypothetical protein